MGAHRSPLVVDESGDMGENEVKGLVVIPQECDPQPHPEGLGPPSLLLPPSSHPNTPGPLVSIPDLR